jgi:acyl-CoA thioesterase FadM
MSNYNVIRAASLALRSALWAEFERDGEIKRILGDEGKIDFKSPAEIDKSGRLSLWLYHLTENDFVSNQQMVRGEGSERFRPPLALNLYYLITPFAGANKPEDLNLLLLGKTMQVLNDNATFVLDSLEDEISEEFHIILNQGCLEELTRVWDSLKEPYRLSVCYQAKTVRIDSRLTLRSEPVRSR